MYKWDLQCCEGNRKRCTDYVAGHTSELRRRFRFRRARVGRSIPSTCGRKANRYLSSSIRFMLKGRGEQGVKARTLLCKLLFTRPRKLRNVSGSQHYRRGRMVDSGKLSRNVSLSFFCLCRSFIRLNDFVQAIEPSFWIALIYILCPYQTPC